MQKGTIAGLLPGRPSQPIDFKVHNPNSGDEGLDWVDIEGHGYEHADLPGELVPRQSQLQPRSVRSMPGRRMTRHG